MLPSFHGRYPEPMLHTALFPGDQPHLSAQSSKSKGRKRPQPRRALSIKGSETRKGGLSSPSGEAEAECQHGAGGRDGEGKRCSKNSRAKAQGQQKTRETPRAVARLQNTGVLTGREESTQVGEGRATQDLDYPAGAEPLCCVVGTGGHWWARRVGAQPALHGFTGAHANRPSAHQGWRPCLQLGVTKTKDRWVLEVKNLGQHKAPNDKKIEFCFVLV